LLRLLVVHLNFQSVLARFKTSAKASRLKQGSTRTNPLMFPVFILLVFDDTHYPLLVRFIVLAGAKPFK
jgi:hypothetical protein